MSVEYKAHYAFAISPVCYFFLSYPSYAIEWRCIHNTGKTSSSVFRCKNWRKKKRQRLWLRQQQWPKRTDWFKRMWQMIRAIDKWAVTKCPNRFLSCWMQFFSLYSLLSLFPLSLLNEMRLHVWLNVQDMLFVCVCFFKRQSNVQRPATVLFVIWANLNEF